MGVEADACNPLVNEPRVLSCRDAPSRTPADDEHKFAGPFFDGPYVIVDRLTSLSDIVDTGSSRAAFCPFGGNVPEGGMKPLAIIISFDVGK